MRLLLILVSVGCILTGLYFAFLVPRLYATHSRADLAVLEEAYAAAAATDPEAGLKHALIREEWRRRTWLVPGSFVVAGLVALLAFLVPAGSSRSATAEDARLAAFIGNVGDADGSDRTREAAELLGVSPRAPAEVIEAAYRAHLDARGPSAASGRDPAQVRLAEEHLRRLAWARELLISRRAAKL